MSPMIATSLPQGLHQSSSLLFPCFFFLYSALLNLSNPPPPPLPVFQEMLKCSKGEGTAEFEEALATMLDIIKSVNDSMHQIAITGFEVSMHNHSFIILIIIHQLSLKS